jgi:hypothetical protein
VSADKLTFLSRASYDRLLSNITSNHHRYVENLVWLPTYFASPGWSVQSNSVAVETFTLVPPDSKADFSESDLANTKIVFSALKHLTPLQASDSRLWAYLSHVSQWSYMRKRWPVEQYLGKPRFREIVQERYLFMPDRSRALIRNGIARLWWYGYCSFDDTRKDPYELTSVLLKNLDVTQSILERAFSRNTEVTRALLSVLLEREKEGKAFYVRDKVRDLAKYIVQVGGVTIVDALDAVDLRTLVESKIEELATA